MKQGLSLFEAIGGTPTCRRLSAAFYARVERDPVLRPLFPGVNLHCAVEAFTAFLVQFLGGPSEDSQRRWFVSLHESHQRFAINERHKAAWLRLMDKALQDAEIEDPARVALRNLFERAATYLVDGKPGPQRLNQELGKRWTGQRTADEVVALIRQGKAARAIKLMEGCPRPILPGMVQLMLQSGDAELLAFVQRQLAEDPFLANERYGGRTLLHMAAAAGSLSTVKMLLRLGLDPNALDDGKHTPLYSVGNECAGSESADVVRTLVHAGADVDAADGVTAATPLHMAARRGNAVVAQALLECGADIRARDRRGATPLKRAINCKKLHVAELLRAWGTKPQARSTSPSR